MKKVMNKSCMWLLLLVFAISIMASMLVFSPYTIVANAAEGDGVLLDEKFDTSVPGTLENYLLYDSSTKSASTKGVDAFALPLSMVKSNNYEVSINLTFPTGTGFRFIFVGLDGTNKDNISFDVINRGQFYKIASRDTDVYDNSTFEEGALMWGGGERITQFNFKAVVFEGYVEIYINNERCIVSHLSNFGNNKYRNRVHLTEGIISEIKVQSDSAGVIVDDILVKEARGGATTYYEESTNTDVGSSKTMPLSAQNLYKDNYTITGTYHVNKVITDADGYYPTIRLFGINNSVDVTGDFKGYVMNFQTHITSDGNAYSEIFYHTNLIDWVGKGGNPGIILTDGANFTQRIEVYGEHLDFYVNDCLIFATTFTELGIEKGHIQYIQVTSGNEGAYYTSFKYEAKETVIGIASEQSAVELGTPVVVNSTIYGDNSGEFVWYVDDVAKTGADKGQITLTDLTEGKHTICLKKGAIVSNVLNIEVFSTKIEIKTKSTSVKKGEDVTITSTIVGGMGATFTWYVDGVAQVSEKEALTLKVAKEPKEKFTVMLKTADGKESNVLTFVVAFDVIAEIEGKVGYGQLSKDEIIESGVYGNYKVGTEAGNNYLYSVVKNDTSWYNFEAKNIPGSASCVYGYKVFIPKGATGYIYAPLVGLDSKYSAQQVEAAIEVTETGVLPYYKNNGLGKVVATFADNGMNVNLDFGGGVVNTDEWIDVKIAIMQGYTAIYINGQMTILYSADTLTTPTACTLCTFPKDGLTTLFRFDDLATWQVKEPAPALASVSISTSAIKLEVGKTATLSATLNPFNAESKVIAWYINDVKVDGANALTYTFSSKEAGEYSIYCIIDGIKSNVKVVTVTAPVVEKSGCCSSISIIGTVALLLVILSATFIIIKRKNSVND